MMTVLHSNWSPARHAALSSNQAKLIEHHGQPRTARTAISSRPFEKGYLAFCLRRGLGVHGRLVVRTKGGVTA